MRGAGTGEVLPRLVGGSLLRPFLASPFCERIPPILSAAALVVCRISRTSGSQTERMKPLPLTELDFSGSLGGEWGLRVIADVVQGVGVIFWGMRRRGRVWGELGWS